MIQLTYLNVSTIVLFIYTFYKPVFLILKIQSDYFSINTFRLSKRNIHGILEWW